MIYSEILFRKNKDVLEEFKIAKKYFAIKEQRTNIESNSLIISRYSCLPYYKEFENDITNMGCSLINDYKQHKWIADFEYYQQLKDFTFKTYEYDDFVKNGKESKYVVKGKTNSRKNYWNKLMFADCKQRALEIAWELMKTPLIEEQDIIIREYVPLKTLEYGINGLPFSNEWRLFYYKDQLLTKGFYWQNVCDCPEKSYFSDKALKLANKIANIAKNYTNFFVIDLAEQEDGKWILVEINDGQMSGLSGCNPDELYLNLYNILN